MTCSVFSTNCVQGMNRRQFLQTGNFEVLQKKKGPHWLETVCDWKSHKIYQRFSNYGSRTTGGAQAEVLKINLYFWLKFQLQCYTVLAELLCSILLTYW